MANIKLARNEETIFNIAWKVFKTCGQNATKKDVSSYLFRNKYSYDNEDVNAIFDRVKIYKNRNKEISMRC